MLQHSSGERGLTCGDTRGPSSGRAAAAEGVRSVSEPMARENPRLQDNQQGGSAVVLAGRHGVVPMDVRWPVLSPTHTFANTTGFSFPEEYCCPR